MEIPNHFENPNQLKMILTIRDLNQLTKIEHKWKEWISTRYNFRLVVKD